MATCTYLDDELGNHNTEIQCYNDTGYSDAGSARKKYGHISERSTTYCAHRGRPTPEPKATKEWQGSEEVRTFQAAAKRRRQPQE